MVALSLKHVCTNYPISENVPVTDRTKRDTSGSMQHPLSRKRVRRDGHLELECCCGHFCNQRGKLDDFPAEGCQPPTCPGNLTLCAGTNKCIEPALICDGIAQCSGGADEANCTGKGLSILNVDTFTHDKFPINTF